MSRDDRIKQSEKDALIANVALLYYGEGLTQNEIAQRMGVSRPTVVNMLRDSRESGMVEIRVAGESLTGSSLSRALKDRFGLTDVYIARSRNRRKGKAGRDEVLAQVARVAAMAMLDIVRSGDVMGVAWGETIKAMSLAMTKGKVDDVTVCQLIGSMVSDRVPTSEDCAIRIAQSLNADCFTLHAPAVLSSEKLARALIQEPTIAAQLERLKNLDLVVYGVGGVQADTHLVAADIASGDELQAAIDAGAKGILCCRYVDENGQALPMPPESRVVAITLEQLRETPRKFVVIAGEDRLDAALAVLRGELATHLCVDEGLAEALLQAS